MIINITVNINTSLLWSSTLQSTLTLHSSQISGKSHKSSCWLMKRVPTLKKVIPSNCFVFWDPQTFILLLRPGPGTANGWPRHLQGIQPCLKFSTGIRLQRCWSLYLTSVEIYGSSYLLWQLSWTVVGRNSQPQQTTNKLALPYLFDKFASFKSSFRLFCNEFKVIRKVPELYRRLYICLEKVAPVSIAPVTTTRTDDVTTPSPQFGRGCTVEMTEILMHIEIDKR